MLIPSPQVFENFIAVNNTFAIGKGDNRKKNSKDETTITPRSFNFIIRNTMNVIRDRYYQPKIIFSFGTGNWWEGGITSAFFLPERWPETATSYTWPTYLRAHMHGNRRCSVWFVTGQTVPPRFPSFRDTSLRHASDDTATTTSFSIRATASGLASSGEREFLRNCGDETVNGTFENPMR